MSFNRFTVALVATAVGASLLVSPSAAHAAPAPARPDPIIETSNLSDGSGRVRVVLPVVPSGVRKYVIRHRDTGKVIKRCHRNKMANGSGANGCYVDISSGFFDRWVIRAVAPSGATSAPTYVPADDLSSDEGTTQVIYVSGSVASAARVYVDVARVFREQATGCAKDAAVKQGMKSLKKLSTKAARKSKNPYVATAALLSNAVVAYDKKAGFKNRCSAIASLVSNVAAKVKQAREDNALKFVYATSSWVRVDRAPDFCHLYSSGSSANSRPSQFGGLNESDCKHFWGSMVS